MGVEKQGKTTQVENWTVYPLFEAINCRYFWKTYTNVDAITCHL